MSLVDTKIADELANRFGLNGKLDLMGQTVSKKILEALGAGTLATELIDGWFLSNSNVGAGIALLRFGEESTGGEVWVAPRNGKITKISGAIVERVTYQGFQFGVNRNGVDFYGNACATIGSGASVVSAVVSLTIYSGDRIYMVAGTAGESLAPLNKAIRGSFEVQLNP